MSSSIHFQVAQDTTTGVAITHAGSLLRGLREIAEQGVEAGSMDADVCFAVASGLASAVALLNAIESAAVALARPI